MRTVLALLGSALSVLVASATYAQIEFEGELNPAFAVLADEASYVIEPLEQDAENSVGQSVGNGQIVDPRFFQGVLRMRTGGTCTASLVGPAVILIAAHCVEEDRRIRLCGGRCACGRNCVIAPTYNPDRHSDDWSLCLLERRVAEDSIVFETVDIETRPADGTRVALVGYGCTVRNGLIDGRLRLGFSTLASRPPGFRREPTALYTSSNVPQGEAYLCPGDSGGPLFIMGDDAAGPRKIVGVNSRTTYEYGVSVFSALASPAGASFVLEFVELTNAEICGVNRDLGCK